MAVSDFQNENLQGLIVAAGAFIGSLLGNVVRPLLDHYLQGKAERRQRAKANAESQFTQLYKALYDLFEDGVAPDSSFDEITPDVRDRIVDMVSRNRHLAEPDLERSISEIVETRWSARGAGDAKALESVWTHVQKKYNALRGELGLLQGSKGAPAPNAEARNND